MVRDVIRRATAADIDRILELRFAFLEEVGRSVDDELRRSTADYLRRSLPARDCVFWLGDAGDAVVATGGMCIYERMMWNGAGREGYVLSMYTVPDYRGRGIGAAIVREMTRFASEEGLKLCLISLDEARPIYERAGFETDHRYMRWR